MGICDKSKNFSSLTFSLKNILVVRRGISSTFTQEQPSYFELIKNTLTVLSKTTALIGIGIIGSAVFRYNEFPLHFYIICITLSFVIYTLSISQVLHLSQNAKLNSIAGAAALYSSACTFSTIFSLFTALISVSGITIMLAIFLTTEIITHNFSYIPPLLTVPIIFGICFMSCIWFVRKREVSYHWAKLSFASILILMSLLNLTLNFDKTSNVITKGFQIPFHLSATVFYEALTVISVSLLSLFCATASDPNVLKAKKNGKTTKSVTLWPLILSNGIGLCLNLIISMLLQKQILSIFFSDLLIENVVARTAIGVIFVLSILIQSFEYFDSAHNLLYEFFKPLTEETLLSLKSVYFREFLLGTLVSSISYFIDSSVKGSVNVMVCIFGLALSVPFLIMPVVYMTSLYRKSEKSIGIGYLVSCLLTSCMGITLTISNVFGLASTQNPFIQWLAILFIRDFFILTIFSVLIYFICMVLDVIVYRPQTILPLKHRTIRDIGTVTYGKNYMAEIVITICAVATFAPSVSNLIYTIRDNSGLYENGFLIAADYFLRIFIHEDIIHLLFNGLCIYYWGKKISSEIGPFHFLAFFLVSGLFSGLGANILFAYLQLTLISGIGASGAGFALFAKYIFEKGIIYKFKFIPVSGHEYMIYTILLCTVLILTRIIPRISHEAHLSGFIFGIFCWSVSIELWKLRDKIHRKLIAQND